MQKNHAQIWIVAGIAAMSAVLSVFATDGTWIGKGADAKWGTAENWQDGVIPGRWTVTNSDSSVTTNGTAGGKATFGPVEAGAHTTIDLSDQFTIQEVEIAAGAPSYMFGTVNDNTQRLSFDAANTKFTMKDGVTNPQTILRVGLHNSSTWHNFENYSTALLTIGDYAKSRNFTSSYGCTVYYYGSGPITYDGKVTWDQVSGIAFRGTGRYAWNDRQTCASAWRFSNGLFGEGINQAFCDVEIGTHLYNLGGSWTWSTPVSFKAARTHVHGPGVLSIHVPYNNRDGNETPQAMTIDAGATAVIDVGVVSKSGMTAKDMVIMGGNDTTPGTIYLNSSNSLARSLRLFDNVVCYAKMIGNKGCTAAETSIPRGDVIVFESYWTGVQTSNVRSGYAANDTRRRCAALKYSGDVAASTDRDIMISNMYATTVYVMTNTFANAGGGKFTLNSAFRMAETETDGWQRKFASESAFRLQGETEDLDFNGSFQADKTWHLLFAGPKAVNVLASQPNVTGNLLFESGTARMANPAVFPNAAAWQFAGGGLEFTDADLATTITPVFLRGASTIRARAGQTLTVDGFDGTLPAGATVDFAIEEGARVKLSAATAASDMPTAVTVNGGRSHIDADGYIVERKSVWASAVDGDWTESAKWIGGVPSEVGSVYVTASGASYTVGISGDPILRWDQVVVSNATADATATLDGGIFFEEGATLLLGKGGKWSVSSGEAVWNPSNTQVGLAGGELEVAGTAKFFFTNTVSGGRVKLGTGTTTVKDAAEVVLTRVVDGTARVNEYTPHLVVVPNAAGETARLNLAGTPKFTVHHDGKRIHVGGGVKGGRSIVDYNLATDNTQLGSSSVNTYMGWVVGSQNGYGELNLRGGRLQLSNGGLHLGAMGFEPNSSLVAADAGCFPTGVLNQTGGLITGGSYQGAYASQVWGTIIGAGAGVVNGGNLGVGIYNLRGGTFSSANGLFIIGAGPYAEGYLHQTGGSFTYAPDYQHAAGGGTDYYTHPLLIGFGGAKGEYHFGAGTGVVGKVAKPVSMYVGGALVNQIGLTGKSYHADLVYSLAGKGTGEGLFSITGGTFTVTKDIILGVDGRGTLELGGGTLSCVDLVLSNHVASVVTCVLNEDGAPSTDFTASGKIAILGGAKLVVDASKARRIRRRAKLLAASSVEGSFDLENDVEFITTTENAKRFKDATLLYSYKGQSGVFLETLPIGTMILMK